jgi:hypothetical protein
LASINDDNVGKEHGKAIIYMISRKGGQVIQIELREAFALALQVTLAFSIRNEKLLHGRL